MSNFELQVVPGEKGWHVESRDAVDGPYATAEEAFDIAVAAARVLQAAGHGAHICMQHDRARVELTLTH